MTSCSSQKLKKIHRQAYYSFVNPIFLTVRLAYFYILAAAGEAEVNLGMQICWQGLISFPFCVYLEDRLWSHDYLYLHFLWGTCTVFPMMSVSIDISTSISNMFSFLHILAHFWYHFFIMTILRGVRWLRQHKNKTPRETHSGKALGICLSHSFSGQDMKNTRNTKKNKWMYLMKSFHITKM